MSVTSERLKALLAEYGRIALWTYFVLFLVVLGGFALAISLGFQIESAKGGVGLLGASYVATKLTQPLRIGATLLLTPLLARLFGHRKAKPAAAPEAPAVELGDRSADPPHTMGG